MDSPNRSPSPRLQRVDSDWRYPDLGAENETDDIVEEYSRIMHTGSFDDDDTAKELVDIRAKTYGRLSLLSRDHEKDKVSRVISQLSLHSNFSRLADRLPMEWYAVRLGGLGLIFDLETWWRRSKNFIRLHAFVIVLLVVIFACHLIAGLTFIALHFVQTLKDPYLCTTPECKQASYYLSQTMNTEEDPCSNFYEFMCGNYDEEQTKNLKFDRLLIYPAFTQELGEPTLLSKILKDFKNDPAHDQSIRYYQSCLNEPNKQARGIEALLDRIEYIFGTRDFSTFNTATEPSMEEIATRLFQVLGHAVFLDISFSTYPYIQVMKTPRQFQFILDGGFRFGKTAKYLNETFKYLMPKLGIPADSPDIQEMVTAVGFWAFLFNNLQSLGLRTDFSLPDGEATYKEKFKKKAHMCPPMNIKFNYKVVFDNFIQDSNWQEEYYDHEAETYFGSLKQCFSKSDGFNYTHEFGAQVYNLTPGKNRLAFVSLWLYGLFQEILPIMHSDFIVSYTKNINDEEWDDVIELDRFYFTERKIHTEYKCLNELWRSLGYMPSLRYLSANVKDPVDYMQNNMQEIHELYKKIRKLYLRIPKNEIHPFMARQGELLLRRELQVDLIMPLVGKIFDTLPDKLDFTNDHLNNYFVALNLTIQSGRSHWLASTDRRRSPKWWGFGSKTNQENIEDSLRDLESPFTDPARYDKTKPGVFTENHWRSFLGREDYNYIMFPLSLYNEPHITETFALKSSGNVYKIIRTILTLLVHVSDFKTYPYYMEHGLWAGDTDAEKNYLDYRAKMRPGKYNVINEDLKCYTTTVQRGIMFNYAHSYKYPLELHKIQQISSNDWPELNNFFMNVMALKFAFKIFNETRQEILKMNYSSKLPKEIRDFRLHRTLPGEMEKYTEDQLFFMSYTRHMCMKRWNKPSIANSTKNIRYIFEVDVLNILSHTEEFRKTFKCKGKSFMNNRGKPKCFHWVP